MVLGRERVKGTQRRPMHDQPDVGLAGSSDAVDVVLKIAQNEDDTIGIGKMIDGALPRGCLGRRGRLAHRESTK